MAVGVQSNYPRWGGGGCDMVHGSPPISLRWHCKVTKGIAGDCRDAGLSPQGCMTAKQPSAGSGLIKGFCMWRAAFYGAARPGR